MAVNTDLLKKYNDFQVEIKAQYSLKKRDRLPQRKIDEMKKRSSTIKRWLADDGHKFC